ncbi:MAG: Gfo/Idh/MocA family oxidoreductase [Chloroflexi bacterium]|nr:Gfo/Idh/MocA family oxidoreductase [Chloroflexota bacterium]
MASVDPVNQEATYAAPDECPTEAYDAVVLAVPDREKLPLLRYFLGRGKHVLVEKPLLFGSRPEAEALSELARAHQAVWHTSYNHRFEPLIVALAQWLRQGGPGQLYHARFFYGNGTAGNIRGTWREHGRGVLEDLVSHLLDLAEFLLGYGGTPFESLSMQRNELATFDHAVLGSQDRRLQLEASYVCWKNTFAIDIYGELGSAHLNGLLKWGPSELTLRRRVFPSGVPDETVERRRAAGDPTWQADLDAFEARCRAGQLSYDNDLWIASVLDEAGRLPRLCDLATR